MVAFFLPKRRPMDNVEWDMKSPQEDEFALNIMSGESPCMGWIFPERRENYDRYLTFRDASSAEVVRWQRAFVLFLKKLTWKYGRPLVLKSPPHTGRVKLLLGMFPHAKFIHIHRNPYAVFASTRHMLLVNGELNRLQRSRGDDLDALVLRQYARMYEAYFEERALIPKGNHAEVRFEELEDDPLGQVRRVFDALRLPDFDQAEPAIRRYVDSVAGYQKNAFAELPAALRDRIARKWRPCFEAWGYAAIIERGDGPGAGSSLGPAPPALSVHRRPEGQSLVSPPARGTGPRPGGGCTPATGRSTATSRHPRTLGSAPSHLARIGAGMGQPPTARGRSAGGCCTPSRSGGRESPF
jgi:hypothetical protein